MPYNVDMALDRLRFHNILVQEMDVPTDSATMLADVVDQGIQEGADGLLTEQSFREEMARFRAEYMEELNRHLRWLLTTGIALGTAMLALLALIVTRL